VSISKKCNVEDLSTTSDAQQRRQVAGSGRAELMMVNGRSEAAGTRDTRHETGGTKSITWLELGSQHSSILKDLEANVESQLLRSRSVDYHTLSLSSQTGASSEGHSERKKHVRPESGRRAWLLGLLAVW
jgi:hypothetical protein